MRSVFGSLYPSVLFRQALFTVHMFSARLVILEAEWKLGRAVLPHERRLKKGVEDPEW